MRVAALYDIHRNLPALEAVIQEVRQADVQHAVAGGDVVPGPMPRQVLNSLQTLDVPVQFIYGNCEVAMLEQMSDRDPIGLPASYRPIRRWTAKEMTGYRRCAPVGARRAASPCLASAKSCFVTEHLVTRTRSSRVSRRKPAFFRSSRASAQTSWSAATLTCIRPG